MTSKEVQKYQKKSLPALHRLAKEWFNRFIRLRDIDETGKGYCIVTGQPLTYKTEQSQAGHYFAAGKYKSLEFNEDNVHLQSKQDNYYGHDFAMYTVHLIKKIGIERFNQLEILAKNEKRNGFRQDKLFLIDIIVTYKNKALEMAKMKGIEI